MQHNRLQCITMRHNAVQYISQRSATQGNATWHNGTQQNATCYSATRHNAMKRGGMHAGKLACSREQYTAERDGNTPPMYDFSTSRHSFLSFLNLTTRRRQCQTPTKINTKITIIIDVSPSDLPPSKKSSQASFQSRRKRREKSKDTSERIAETHPTESSRQTKATAGWADAAGFHARQR